MKASFRYTAVLLIAVLLLGQSCKKRLDRDEEILNLIQYVDPFIGTGGHGHTYPGATLPYGMVQVSPDNGKTGWDWSSGYHYSSDTIAGFSHTHLSGTGIGDELDISLLPTGRELEYSHESQDEFDITSYYSSFTHENETAEPGYYQVMLDDAGVNVELTATKRTAFHKYTFTDTRLATLFLDLGFEHNYDSTLDTHIKVVSDTLISGFRYSTGWAPNQKVFFAIRFSLPTVSYHIITEDSLALGDERSMEARNMIGAFQFSVNVNAPLQLKVGISSVSEENALINVNNELDTWDFEVIRERAKAAWEKELRRIRITDEDETRKKVFYTGLYHTMLSPNILSDSVVNNRFEYRNIHDQIVSDTAFTNYHVFSLWDTYRTLHPLMTIINPAKVNEFIKAMMAHYRDSGLLPVWSLWGKETNTMIGYHAVPVVADAYMKGIIKEADSSEIYDALMGSAFQSVRDLPLYRKYGYIPADSITNSVSKTLEYAYDDWCIAQVAEKLGRSDHYDMFSKRSQNYRNVFDPKTLFMRARLSNGNWKEPFDPIDTRYDNDYTEGNAWQYLWYVPHDIPGLISLMGGKNVFEEKLDKLFSMSSSLGENAVVDVSGMIGQYVHGNEPSHHIAYMYNYIGKPEKTQNMVRRIMDELYSDQPDGLCGNEDCGQMSAWYIMSALGMYPVNPANGLYDLGIPLFDRAEIELGNGKYFTIVKTGEADGRNNVTGYQLNGEALDALQITHRQIMNGGTLEFIFGE